MKIYTTGVTIAMLLSATVASSSVTLPQSGDMRRVARYGVSVPELSAEGLRTVRKIMKSNEGEPSILLTPPAGEERIMVKGGTGYGCDGMFSVWKQPADGTLVNTVTTSDGKFYMNSVFSQVLPEESGIIDYGGMPCDYSFEYGYIEGVSAGDAIEFQMPQLVQRVVWDLDMGMGLGDEYIFRYEYYALVLQWDEEEGTYVPCEDQTFRMIKDDNGAYRAENPELMIGQCVLWDGDSDDAYYSWQMNGDINISLREQTAEVAQLPSGLDFETWNLIGEISGRPVEVAFLDGRCYIKGLCTGRDMGDAAVVGVVDDTDDTVFFPSSQFIGNYYAEMTEAYFIGYDISDGESVMADGLTLRYDRERKVMSAEECGFAFSTMPERILSFQRVANPYIAMSRGDVTPEALPMPVITDYYPADGYYDAELMFDIPSIDTEKNLLDIARLSYCIIMGDEESQSPFTFYNDEYLDLSDDMDGVTEIPFGFATGYDFSYDNDNGHSLLIYPRGYTVLGVQTIYRQGDLCIKSPVAYVEGLAPVGISAVGADSGAVVSDMYFDMQGRPVSADAKGILVRRTVTADGNIVSSKVMGK